MERYVRNRVTEQEQRAAKTAPIRETGSRTEEGAYNRKRDAIQREGRYSAERQNAANAFAKATSSGSERNVTRGVELENQPARANGRENRNAANEPKSRRTRRA
jgi:hypothetical protein